MSECVFCGARIPITAWVLGSLAIPFGWCESCEGINGEVRGAYRDWLLVVTDRRYVLGESLFSYDWFCEVWEVTHG